jgi:hypothetical protein
MERMTAKEEVGWRALIRLEVWPRVLQARARVRMLSTNTELAKALPRACMMLNLRK